MAAQPKKVVLSLDQSSQVTGWAIFIEGQYETSGVISAKGSDVAQRLVKLKNEVAKLIEEYNVTEVIFEDIQLQSNVNSNVSVFKVLAEVIGMLIEYFAEIKMPSSSVLATVWKSKVGIKGRTRAIQKANAQQYVLDTYDKKLSEDECDAICIGVYKTLIDDEEFNWD